MKRIFALLITALIIISCTACDYVSDFINSGYENMISDAHEQANKEITRGSINGNVYTSEFTGVTFTKPDHWRYYTDEEIAEVMNIGTEKMDIDFFSKTAAEIASVYDMLAVNDATGISVAILYENLTVTNGGYMSAEKYRKILKNSIVETYSAEITEEASATISGNTYLTLSFLATIDGTEIEQTYYLRNTGDYMNLILITYPTGTVDRDVESMFS